MSASPVEYNGTIPTGGDSLTEDLNIFYSVRDRLCSFTIPTTFSSSPTMVHGMPVPANLSAFLYVN